MSLHPDPTDRSSTPRLAAADVVHVWLLSPRGRLTVRRSPARADRWDAPAITPLHGATPAIDRVAAQLGFAVDPHHLLTVGPAPVRADRSGRPEYARVFVLCVDDELAHVAAAPDDELSTVDPDELTGWLRGDDLTALIWRSGEMHPGRLTGASAPDRPFMYWAQLHATLSRVA